MNVLFNGRGFAGFLFDMDGTLLTSIQVAERSWTRWAAQFGLDAMEFLPRMHGMRVPDAVASLGIPGIDPEAEAEKILAAELADMSGVREIPGAAQFVASLPPDKWAVVTSAPRLLAERRLAAAGLPLPGVLVTAEEVDLGKPDPSCFLLAAELLGCEPTDCLVFEDAPVGIRAGVASGAAVLVISGAHRQKYDVAHPTASDYKQLQLISNNSNMSCRLSLCLDFSQDGKGK